MEDIIKYKTRSLIAQNKISEAFKILLDTVEQESENYPNLILIYSRYNQLKNHMLMGTIDNSISHLEINRITRSLLHILEVLSESDFEKDITLNVLLAKPEPQSTLVTWFKNLLKRLF